MASDLDICVTRIDAVTMLVVGGELALAVAAGLPGRCRRWTTTGPAA